MYAMYTHAPYMCLCIFRFYMRKCACNFGRKLYLDYKFFTSNLHVHKLVLPGYERVRVIYIVLILSHCYILICPTDPVQILANKNCRTRWDGIERPSQIVQLIKQRATCAPANKIEPRF